MLYVRVNKSKRVVVFMLHPPRSGGASAPYRRPSHQWRTREEEEGDFREKEEGDFNAPPAATTQTLREVLQEGTRAVKVMWGCGWSNKCSGDSCHRNLRKMSPRNVVMI